MPTDKIFSNTITGYVIMLLREKGMLSFDDILSYVKERF